jgi:hypothetical protein
MLIAIKKVYSHLLALAVSPDRRASGSDTTAALTAVVSHGSNIHEPAKKNARKELVKTRAESRPSSIEKKAAAYA